MVIFYFSFLKPVLLTDLSQRTFLSVAKGTSEPAKFLEM
jgi:hypothetical protein